MEIVRQAHLPGNYELYDEDANAVGFAICKHCWEGEQLTNSSSLDTVWLSVDGWNVVLWLCKGHHQGIAEKAPSMRIVRTEAKVVRYPVMSG